MAEITGRDLIAYRTARFFEDGDLVNLGIGMPTKCLDFLPEGVDVWIDTENGAIGLSGPPAEDEWTDPDVVDASGAVSKLREGGCCFDSFTSFGYIRGGHVAATVLGAYEVDQEGNLANWMVPGRTIAGMGGAMDLVAGARKVLIMTDHCDKKGNPKILKKCTLPLTAAKEVDYIITELAVLHQTPNGLVLEELAPGVSVEEVVSKTAAELVIPAEIKSMI
ncbi:MAG: 3-oxoacid CoA-transferase subunit B [Oscillospiraceae bacterium]|jgi:3-oxoacid CoA-transferase B subunit|nr:3-oxoacid CoA-transferase subunit B [Oscillospiraceae bacterium]